VTYILPLTVWVYLHSICFGGLRKRIFSAGVQLAVQSHARSLILVRIERAHETSYYLSTRSNLGPWSYLIAPFRRYCRFFMLL